VSDDGSVIVGRTGELSPSTRRAFIWTAETGMVLMSDFLTANDETDHQSWNYLEIARTISADGRTIAGWGYDENWFFGSWVVRFEEVFIPQTIRAEMTCSPSAGTLPLSIELLPSLCNDEEIMRRIGASIDVTLASGSHFSNWRTGSVTVTPGVCFQPIVQFTLPDYNSLLGENLFTLNARDVTPAPYNQPPYSPSGATDTSTCTITGQ
jgi:hypothetical protein